MILCFTGIAAIIGIHSEIGCLFLFVWCMFCLLYTSRQGLACKRRQILRPQRRNDHAGEEIGRKMHAGEMKKGRGQRAHGGKFPAGRVETPEPAEKREEKCTPARRRTTGASVQKEANSQRASSKRTSQRRNRMKNARRRGEERQRPACKRRQTPRRRAVFQYM